MHLVFLVAGAQYPRPQDVTGWFDEDENKTHSVQWLSQSPDFRTFEHNLVYLSVLVQSTKQKIMEFLPNLTLSVFVHAHTYTVKGNLMAHVTHFTAVQDTETSALPALLSVWIRVLLRTTNQIIDFFLEEWDNFSASQILVDIFVYVASYSKHFSVPTVS